MIIQSADLGPGAELTTQVCIVGSGPAGITVALQMARRGIDTIVVAGGGLEESRPDRDLYRGEADPPGSHEPLEEGRVRAYGGTSKNWGGRLVPFDTCDFEERDHVRLGAWPFDFEDLDAHVPEATRLCEVENADYEVAADRDLFDLPETIGDGAIVTSRCERWSPPTDFGRVYRSELEQSQHVRVLLDVHCTGLDMASGGEGVVRARLAARGLRPFAVRAATYVLAAGGIENARLLMASGPQRAGGVGNHSGMLGRCYMSHLSGIYGSLRWNGENRPALYDMKTDGDGSFYRRRFWLSPEAQRRERVLNVIAFPFRPQIEDPGHRDPVLSWLFLFQQLRHRNERDWRLLRQHAGNVVRNPAALFSAAQQLSRRYSGAHRLPFVVPHAARNRDALYFQSEHAPNPDSRIELTGDTDEFGVPRVVARVRFTDMEFDTVAALYRSLDRSLRDGGYGHVEYDEAGLRDFLHQRTARFNSIAHHMGTTRASDLPAVGVVDGDCRVHHVDNLYIAGSSVFPTSGHANPTLSIVALALRLSDHLASRWKEARVGDDQPG